MGTSLCTGAWKASDARAGCHALQVSSSSEAMASRRLARQVGRARQLIALYQGRVKPILVGGSYLDLMQSWHVPVYYDQQGLLTHRLGITQVPALVSQEGLRLRIDELAVSP